MNVFIMIAVCSIVTMAPRIVPYFLPFISRLPKFIRKCMLLLPIAALGPLIFPLALTDFGSKWIAGLFGVVSAFVVSYLKGPMILSIIVSLLVTSGVLYII